MLLALTLSLSVGEIVRFVVMLAAFFTALGVLSRLRLVKWLWHQTVVAPFTEWFRREVGEVVDEKLDARPMLNGKGTETIEKVSAIAEKLEVD